MAGMRALLPGLLAILPYCSAQYADFSIPSTYTNWDNEGWELSTDRLIQGQYQSRAPMGNGYIGCALAAAGPFFEADVNLTNPDGGNLPINGWPLDNPRQTFCTVSGFFNSQKNTTRTNFPELLLKGGESVIAGIPNWPNLILEVEGATLNASVNNATISDFKSTRSLKNGLQTWSYIWTPSPNTSLSVSYEMFMDRSQPNVAAVRLSINSSSSINATITDLIDGRGAVRSDPHSTGMLDNSSTIYSAVSPHWLGNITAWIYSTVEGPGLDVASRTNASSSFYLPTNDSTIGQSWNVAFSAGSSVTISKYVGIASSDGFTDPQSVAQDASLQASKTGFDELFKGSSQAWAEILTDDMVDDYTLPNGSLPQDQNVVDMQIISKANAHYLLQNLLPEDGSDLNHWSISVGGLGSDSYAGLIFWDADIFMSPGVSVSHPKYAAQIPKYRVMLSPQAAINAQENDFSSEAIIYPWTSGRYGNCTGTGPCVDYQYHLNSDIFLNNLLYWRVTGDDSWFKGQAIPVNDAIVQMFSELVHYNQTVDGYSISNLTDPDEYANQVPDGAFTLASVAKIIEWTQGYSEEFSLDVEANWSSIAANVALPFAPSGILTEFRGANNTAVIKQDDVDLINYPLDYSSENYTREDKLTSLDYYAVKQSPDGPAMTYSLYSISANALSPSGCSSFTYALNGFKAYTRAPWYQFSEQQVDNFTLNGGTNPAFPFMTGAGGWHQVGPMGWLGARVVEDQLILQPALPPQIPYVSLRTVIFGGAGIKATMNYTHTNLTRMDVSSYLPANSSDIYANQSMPITIGFSIEEGRNISIAMGQTITVENRVYFDNTTTAGNLLQCLPVASEGEYQPGQFPLAAVDGAASTRWQPRTRQPASLTVDMQNVDYQPLTGVSFDWGSRPPTAARVLVYNSTSGSNDSSTDIRTAAFSDISISMPYNAATNDVVQEYTGNMSYFRFSSPIWSGQYVTLEISGCQATGDELGATVAEFNLFGADGASVVGSGAGANGTSTNATTVIVTPSSTKGSQEIVKMALNPQVTNLVIILFMMQVSKKVPFEEPNVLMGVRALYIVSNLIIAGIYLYVQAQINKKKDLTVIKYVEPAPMGSTEEPKPVTTTVHAYDTQQLRGLFKSQLMGVGMMAVMHLYFKYTNPLLIQSIIPLKGAFEGNLVKVHLFGQPAVGELKRPWKASGGLMGMQGAGDIKTDKKSIEAAEKAGRGGAKEE
ncbi:glycoside hydrolase family 65 protein, partial [Aureobasidium melanogenum]